MPLGGDIQIEQGGSSQEFWDTGTAAPTTGNYASGTIIWNGSPTPGTPVGWECVATGNPGTWQDINDLAIVVTANITPGAVTTGTSSAPASVTVNGAVLGNRAAVTYSVDTAGMILHAWVAAANTVKYIFFNPTGATVTLGAGTLKISVLP